MLYLFNAVFKILTTFHGELPGICNLNVYTGLYLEELN